MKSWTRTEGKDPDGYRWFRWTSKLNDDYTVNVQRMSIKIERVSPGAINIIYLTKKAPGYKKHLGYFVTLKKRGESDTRFLGGTVRNWSDQEKRYISKTGKGPWTQAEAMKFAYAHLENPEFNKNYIKPKQYNTQIPGWTHEQYLMSHRWTNDNNGQHQILVHGLFGDYEVKHTFGYGDEKPITIMQRKISGMTNAINYATKYAKSLGQIPLGKLEKTFQKIGEAVKKVPDEKLATMTRMMKKGHLEANDAMRIIFKKQEDQK
jgi:hypothetical protein